MQGVQFDKLSYVDLDLHPAGGIYIPFLFSKRDLLFPMIVVFLFVLYFSNCYLLFLLLSVTKFVMFTVYNMICYLKAIDSFR
jgi:hypothetical protein